MDLNFSAFQEPRGVMRVLHFVFSICAFATICGYTGYINFVCDKDAQLEISYPFILTEKKVLKTHDNTTCSASVAMDFASDARFFVATGVLSMLFSLGIIFVYAKMDDAYRTNKKLPVYDFLLTVFLAVLWLSSSAAWAHSLTSLKTVVADPNFSIPNCCAGGVTTSSFSSLNISVIFGFLNFFLWAADLWFLYKETEFFQANAPPTSSGV